MKRFWDKVKIAGPNDCWEWQAGKDKNGYGSFRIGKGSMKRAPRVAWELKNGPIPNGMVVCHVCDYPACVNPGHLFLGTHGDNMRDMRKKGRHHYAARTHCDNGHEFTAENTSRVKTENRRRCKICKNLKQQEYYARRRAQNGENSRSFHMQKRGGTR